MAGSLRLTYFKKCIKPNWNFQRVGGGGSLEKLPSMGEVWRFFGTTHLTNLKVPGNIMRHLF